MDTRAVKTTDEVTGTKRRILVAGDIKLAGLVAAIRTAHGFAAEAPCSLSYVDEDDDRIQITTDDDLAAAFASVEAGETFRVFVRSGENIDDNSSAEQAIHDESNEKEVFKGIPQKNQNQKMHKKEHKHQNKKAAKDCQYYNPCQFEWNNPNYHEQMPPYQQDQGYSEDGQEEYEDTSFPGRDFGFGNPPRDFGLGFGFGFQQRPFGFGFQQRPFGFGCPRRPFGFGCPRRPFGFGCPRRPFGFGCPRRPFGFGCPRRPFGFGFQQRPFGFGYPQRSFDFRFPHQDPRQSWGC
ncbi:MAG: hypothetical protein EZS28_003849 [Streblomastix strix]|uniref:PB1 domain-containing protein n=1 Tax=Streblomastix strix TaxID=222440 RepID=A0A5J4X1L0_9EUKA|nr:MAG: hypothetical protein EZS28_003849 [Streblomastix strix]